MTWLSFLSWSWLAPQPRPFLLMALLPLALLALLWWLSHYTSNELERQEVPQTDGEWKTPLERRDMWHDGTPVLRLQAVHVSCALAALAGCLLLPVWAAPSGGARSLSEVWAGQPAAVIAGTLAAALVVADAVLLALPGRYRREPGRAIGDGAAPARARRPPIANAHTRACCCLGSGSPWSWPPQ